MHIFKGWEIVSGLVACFLVACVVFVSWRQYRVHDADSRLYAAMSEDLAQLPWHRWCALQWNGHWDRQGWFVEHPPGFFWATALAIDMGLTPFVAIYTVNFISWTISLGVLSFLAYRLESVATAIMAPVIWIVCPVFLQYLVRGDQEHPLTAAILLGVAITLCTHHPLWVSLGWASVLFVATMLKGLPALALIALGLFIGYWRRASHAWWLSFALALCLWVVGCYLFDRWYWLQTGQSFWASYLKGQVAFSVGKKWLWSQKICNLGYYLARPIWFGLPALGLGIYGLKHVTYKSLRLRICFWLGPIVSCLFVGAFSLADRKADRYLFPIYPFLSLSAATILSRTPHISDFFTNKFLNLQRLLLGIGTFLLLCILIKVYVGTYHYTFIRFWPGDY